MRPIPPKSRQVLERDPRMTHCALAPLQRLYGACSGRIRNPEWHHPWTYGGPQIVDPWATVPGCTYHHDMVKKDPKVRDAFERASLELATPEDLAKYPRKDWEQIKKRLWHSQRK